MPCRRNRHASARDVAPRTGQGRDSLVSWQNTTHNSKIQGNARLNVPSAVAKRDGCGTWDGRDRGELIGFRARGGDG
jgi:hypothetical protein